jgi:nicotinamidase/pyrazinamidase
MTAVILLHESSLLVVDAQQGFTTLCPKELPVPGGLEIVSNINRLLELSWARIEASQDWHPPDHYSFFGQRDNLYPPHCVAGTAGADFLPGLQTNRFHAIWRKGFHHDSDGYAICCFFAAHDLRQAGFNVYIVEDASAGIDVPAAGFFQERTKREGQQIGIRYLSTMEIVSLIQ